MADVKPKSTTFYLEEDPLVVGPAWRDTLQAAALADPLKRARLCLHRDINDTVHEMIIVFHRDSYVRPHRHLHKSESFHIISGNLSVLIFDEAGQINRVISLGEDTPQQMLVYRLNTSLWHSVVPLSEWTSVHEVTSGPYIPDQTEFAPWSPAEDDEPGKVYFQKKLTSELGQRK